MFDTKTKEAFLKQQLRLYPEEVASTIEEAEEFLEESCAAVADSPKDVMDYLEDVGVDTQGLNQKDILNMDEIIPIGDGRFLILEI